MAFSLAVLLVVLVIGPSRQQETPTYDPNCPAKWKDLSATHTMCISGDVGEKVNFDPSLVVSRHNQLRAAVTPPASDMRKVYWDKEAAEVASKWARQCNKYGYHEGYKARALPSYKYLSIGQNMAMRSENSWVNAINNWHSEVENFTFGVGPKQPGQVVGHYTQVVSKDVYRIGCGLAECPWNGYKVYFYICNYITGAHSNTPYTSGERCSSCSGNCEDGLCDCGGKVCKLNSSPQGCGCDCQPHMSGDECTDLECQDEGYCGNVPLNYCDFPNPQGQYFRFLCPKQCGLC